MGISAAAAVVASVQIAREELAAGREAVIVTGTCGGGPCKYLVTGNGDYATYNTVKPIFYSASLTDQFHPTSKLSINGGVRMDIFQFQGGLTTGTDARTFFYNAFNLDNCLTAAGDLVAKEPTAACPAGDSAATFSNPSGIVTESYTEFQPRLGATYSLDPATVLRASYGRYTQAPNSAFQQYNTLYQNAPYVLYDVYGFQRFGFTSPDHTVRPPTGNNYDFSFERQFPGQLSMKVSPFYRNTKDQIQQFFLDQQTSFVSGLNVGEQTAEGVEFEIDKGNFNQNGLAAKLSFTYTNSYIHYTALPNGTSVIDPINAAISSYNAYTSACAAGGKLAGAKQYGTPVCGSTPTGVVASACYGSTGTNSPGNAPTGTPVACSAPGAVANPYWLAPAQGLLDPAGNYATYDTFPAGVGTSANAYGAPYNASLILNYKKGPFAITPLFSLSAGQKYGSPLSTYGVTPDACSAFVGSTTAGDPRYPYGAVGGAGFNVTSTGSSTAGCTTGFGIPNPYTKQFDGIGAFTQPAEAQFHLQMTYQLSQSVQLVANFANIYTACFGGSKEPWNVSGACTYGLVADGSTGDIGNQYNPGAAIQPYLNTPYLPTFNPTPFDVYVSARIKL